MRIGVGLARALALAAIGAAALWWAPPPTPPPPDPAPRDWQWTPDPEGLLLDGARTVSLPEFEDFDLLATVELHADAVLDIAAHVVEPYARDGEELQRFHGRFQIARVSAGEEGPMVRSRDAALFDSVAGGARVAPGVPASIKLEGRGRRLRVNVAGRWSEWVEGADARGRLVLMARGGPVVVRYLKVVVVPRSRWPLALWGGGLGMGLAILSLARGRRGGRVFGASVAALVLGALAARWLYATQALPFVAGDPLAAVLLVGSPLPLALAVAAPWRALPRLLAVAAGAGLAVVAAEVAVHREWPRLAASEDSRLDLHFGPASGSAPLDALSLRIRNRGPAVHTLDMPETRVAFLGGGMIFEASPDMAQHVGLRTALALGQRLGREVEGIVVPTVISNALQQLLLFSRFYAVFAPDVVVFAISRFEGESVPAPNPRAVLHATRTAVERPALRLSELWRSAGAPVALSTPAELRLTLEELRAFAAAQGCAVVLVAETGLAPPLRRVVDECAAQWRWPVVDGVVAADGTPRFAPLVEAIEPFLR